MTGISRRDFLKLAAMSLSSAVLSRSKIPVGGSVSSSPNIILLLFDALSARHLSLFGYPRKTSPNFERFSERATVFHSYNSAGNYTIPGVASLLTGLYPWTHRAVNHAGLIRRDMVDRNIFALIGDEYFCTGFAQTGWASLLLTQCKGYLNRYYSPAKFSTLSNVIYDDFPDTTFAYRGLDDFMFKAEKSPASLVLGSLKRTIQYTQAKKIPVNNYPRGIPMSGPSVYFTLDQVFDGLLNMFAEQTSPSFSYVHLFPPHAPYSPIRKFYGKFWNDQYFPPSKPDNQLGDGHDERKVYIARLSYDEYIASLDYEFGRFMDSLDAMGGLENTYLIITSDHGELLERGCKGHDTPLLYDPIVHSPLLIRAPGQTQRIDIHAPVNSVDILPTVLHLAGKTIPDWCAGKILPGFGGQEDYGRSTYTVEAKLNPAFAPLDTTTIAMRKGHYKLIYYKGYFGGEDWFELYNHEEDLEELHDLYDSEKPTAKEMKDELLETFTLADREFLNH